MVFMTRFPRFFPVPPAFSVCQDDGARTVLSRAKTGAPAKIAASGTRETLLDTLVRTVNAAVSGRCAVLATGLAG
jgi:hypothetical protein